MNYQIKINAYGENAKYPNNWGKNRRTEIFVFYLNKEKK